jgi:transposase
MLTHWEHLTMFLKEPGAPLDNNIVERALKMVILHRKNSYFFRTQFEAAIGDLFMSIIATCVQAKQNPFHYMVTIQKHAKKALKNPFDWLPWNYQEQLT